MKSIILALSLLCLGTLSAQKYNKEYLQKQNRELQSEIAKLNKILAQTKKESKNSLVYVVTLKDKIKKRETYLSNATKEKRFIEDDIYLKQLEINKYRRELADLRKDYGKVLVKAYKNKTVQNKILFVLGSKDLSQAFRRVKYLQLYSDYQDDQADEIRAKIAEIEGLKKSREKDIQEKERLLANQKAEIQKLEGEKVEKDKVVQEFKKNEKQIIAQLKQKQAQQQKLDTQIRLAIEEEIAIARKKEEERQARLLAEKRAREEKERQARLLAEKEEKERQAALARNKPSSKTTPTIVSTPTTAPKVESSKPKEVEIPKSDYTKLSEGFANNQGKLPSPLPGGIVVSHYGRHEHPTIPGLMVNNKGVDISAGANGIAKAIFNGKVSRVVKFDGNLMAIMIQHGEYFSVYTNIDDPYVKQGDIVRTGQDIGHVFVNENNRSVTNLMIYKDKQIQNPETWIRLY